MDERVVLHSELRASVDSKVREAIKEPLAKVAEALKCACCSGAPRSWRPLWRSSEGTPTATGRRAPRRRQSAPRRRQPIGVRVPLFGALATCASFCPATPDTLCRPRLVSFSLAPLRRVVHGTTLGVCDVCDVCVCVCVWSRRTWTHPLHSTVQGRGRRRARQFPGH